MSHQPGTVPMSRTWLIASGLIFILAGMAAMSLGILIYLGWPSSSFTVLGVFFGINLLVKGVAQLALGMSSRNATPAAT